MDSAPRIRPPREDPDAGDFRVNDLALGPTGDAYVAGSLARRIDGVWQEHAPLLRFAAGDNGQANHWSGGVRLPSACFESVAVRGYRVVAVGHTVDPANDTVGDALLKRVDLNLGSIKHREWVLGNGTFERLADVVLDGKGNVYVTGEQELDKPGGWSKAVTMKLNQTLARIVWKATCLPGSRDAEGWHIARDGLGNLYVAGTTGPGSTRDILTMKYSSGGARTWPRTWSGGGPGDDEPAGIVLGTTGGVYVGGEADGKGGVLQAVLLKYQR